MNSQTLTVRARRAQIITAASAIAATIVTSAHATLLYESADLGPIGQGTGAVVDSSTFLGIRFQVFGSTTADRLGGHLGCGVLPSTTLFGALVQLSGPGDVPDTQDLSSADVLRTTVLTVPYGSSEVIENFTPISLSAGWYAMVFGSGKFGATGAGMAPLNNDTYGTPSTFWRSGATNWVSNSQPGMRFLIAGPSPKVWTSAVNGNWHDSNKWYTASVPQSYDDVMFDLFSTYTVNLAANGTAHDIRNELSNVTLALGGHTLSTTGQFIVGSDVIGGAVTNVQNGILSPGHDVTIGESGVATMSVSNMAYVNGYATTNVLVGKARAGTLNVGNNGVIYSATGRVADSPSGGLGTGLVTLSNAGIWHVRDSFDVGRYATGIVTLNPGGELHVGGLMSIWNNAETAVHLDGGWLQVGSMYTAQNPSRFQWTSGTFQTMNQFGIGEYGPLGATPSIGANRTWLADGGLQIEPGAQLSVTGGNVTGPITNDSSIIQSGGLTQVTGSNGLTGANGLVAGTLNVTGGTLAARRVRAASIAVGGTGVVKLDVSGATGPSTSRLGTINITGSGKLDITDKKVILPGSISPIGSWNGSAYTGVTGLIQSGRGDGSWNGSGIVTSLTDATSGVLTTVAVATGADLGAGSILWGGEFVSSTSVLVMYTWGGDADLNGELNGDDYFYIDSNVLQNGTVFGFHNGDFNYDGAINGDDYFILDSNILYAQSSGIVYASGGGGLTSVPEPVTLAAVTAGLPLLLRRKRASLRKEG